MWGLSNSKVKALFTELNIKKEISKRELEQLNIDLQEKVEELGITNIQLKSYKELNTIINLKNYKAMRHNQCYTVNGQNMRKNGKTQRKLGKLRIKEIS